MGQWSALFHLKLFCLSSLNLVLQWCNLKQPVAKTFTKRKGGKCYFSNQNTKKITWNERGKWLASPANPPSLALTPNAPKSNWGYLIRSVVLKNIKLDCRVHGPHSLWGKFQDELCLGPSFKSALSRHLPPPQGPTYTARSHTDTPPKRKRPNASSFESYHYKIYNITIFSDLYIYISINTSCIHFPLWLYRDCM